MKFSEESKKQWLETKESWLNEAKTNIHTPEDLKNFAEKLIKQTKHGYDMYQLSADAAAALAHAAIEMCAYVFGMTGFQVGYVLWEIMDKLIIEDHDCGLKLMNFDNMMYPQYKKYFEKTIDKETWTALQEKARKKYSEYEEEILKQEAGDTHVFPAHPDVAAHWKSIVDGNVPFGYEVK